MKLQRIKAKGYMGTWSEIGNGKYNGMTTHLLENDQCGDDTNFLLVTNDLQVLSDEVYDFDCLTNPGDYVFTEGL